MIPVCINELVTGGDLQYLGQLKTGLLASDGIGDTLIFSFRLPTDCINLFFGFSLSSAYAGDATATLRWEDRLFSRPAERMKALFVTSR